MPNHPPTGQQLDEIETRAAHLHEYALLDDEPMQADADQLTGKDVPALVAALRDSRAEIDKLIRWHGEDETAMKRMRATITRLRTENAQLRAARDVIASMHRDLDARHDAVAAFLDEQERAARAFELPTPAWVEAVRAASVPPGAPVSASQGPSVSESAQSPTGAPTGPLSADAFRGEGSGR